MSTREAGEVGVVVHAHRNGEAFEVEFMTLDGNTLTVEMLTAKQIRAARNPRKSVRLF